MPSGNSCRDSALITSYCVNAALSLCSDTSEIDMGGICCNAGELTAAAAVVAVPIRRALACRRGRRARHKGKRYHLFGRGPLCWKCNV